MRQWLYIGCWTPWFNGWIKTGDPAINVLSWSSFIWMNLIHNNCTRGFVHPVWWNTKPETSSAGVDKPPGKEQRDEARGESQHHEDSQRTDRKDLSAEEWDQPHLTRYCQHHTNKVKNRCKRTLIDLVLLLKEASDGIAQIILSDIWF